MDYLRILNTNLLNRYKWYVEFPFLTLFNHCFRLYMYVQVVKGIYSMDTFQPSPTASL